MQLVLLVANISFPSVELAIDLEHVLILEVHSFLIVTIIQEKARVLIDLLYQHGLDLDVVQLDVAKVLQVCNTCIPMLDIWMGYLNFEFWYQFRLLLLVLRDGLQLLGSRLFTLLLLFLS